MARTGTTLVIMAFLAACGGGSSEPDAQVVDAPVMTGTIAFAWALEDPDSAALECVDVAAGSVSITATPAAGGFGQNDPFGCGVGQGVSRGLAPATYNVEFRLGATVGTLATVMHAEQVEVVAGQQVDLGTVTFQVEPAGGLSFQVDTGASAGNCDPQASDGGELTALEIQLQDEDGICIPTTFAVDDPNDANAPDYVSDCAGSTAPCYAKDVTFTVTDAVSGPGKLAFTGYKGGLECYARLSTFTIPGNNLSLSLPNQLLTLASTPACDPNAADAGVMIDAAP